MSEALMKQFSEAIRRRLQTGDEEADRENLFELVREVGERVYALVLSDATQSIWCDELTDEQIIARMFNLENGPTVLTLNGAEWAYEHMELVHQRLGAAGGG